MVTYNSTDDWGITSFIVNPLPGRGKYTTIQAAIDDVVASGMPQVIYIYPHIYVENLDYSGLVNSLDIVAVGIGTVQEPSGAVVISGNCSLLASAAPEISFQGITFENNAPCFSDPAAGTTLLTFVNCVFEASNSWSISLPNWAALLTLINCQTSIVNDGVLNTGPAADVHIFGGKIGTGTGTATVIGARLAAIGVDFSQTVLVCNSDVSINNCSLYSIVFIGASNGHVNNVSITPFAAVSGVVMNSTSNITLSNVVIDVSIVSAITGAGAGILTLNNVSFLNNAVIDPTVTIAYNTTGEAAKPTVFKVDVAGGSPFKTIQSAITAVAATGTAQAILIYPGQYTENLVFPSGIQVTLQGIGGAPENFNNAVVIIGGHTPPATGNVNFQDLWFQSAASTFSSVVAGTANLSFDGCAFMIIANAFILNLDNWTGDFAFQSCKEKSTNTNGLINNSAGASLMILNSVLGTTTPSGTGVITNISRILNSVIGAPIEFRNTGSIVNDCTFISPTTMTGTTETTFADCEFFDAITCSDNSNPAFVDSIIVSDVNPALTQNSTQQIKLFACDIQSGAPFAIDGVGAGTITLGNVVFLQTSAINPALTLDYNTTGEPAKPTPWVVDANGGSPFRTIQSAITASGGNATILVKDGTYIEDLVITPNLVITSLSGTSPTSGPGQVIIGGTMTFASAGSVLLSGIALLDNGVSPVIDATVPSGSLLLDIDDCYIAGVTSQAINIGSGNLINIKRSNIVSVDECVVLSGTSNFVVTDCGLNSLSADAIVLSAAGTVTIKNSSVQANTMDVLIRDPGVVVVSQNNYYLSLTDSCWNYSSAGQIQSSCDLLESSSGSGEAVSGTGTLVFADVIMRGQRAIAPTVTLIPYLTHQGSSFWDLGSTVAIAEGANSIAGVATLVAGTVTVTTTQANTTSRVHLTRQNPNASTGAGTLTVANVVNGASFDITSLNAVAATEIGDLSDVYWTIVKTVV